MVVSIFFTEHSVN